MYLDFELSLIEKLQRTLPALEPVMQFFTGAGLSTPYMMIICLVYWCYNRKLGAQISVFLVFNAHLNETLKQIFQAPRPYWVSPSITGMDGAQGFGLPSGHAQASTFWLFFASLVKKPWFWCLAIIMSVGIGISRIYLGAHFPNQVALGWSLGIISILLFYRYQSTVTLKFSGLSFFQQYLTAAAFCVALLVIGSTIVHFNHLPMEFEQWQANALPSISTEVLHSRDYHGVIATAGSLLGLLVGLIMVKQLALVNSAEGSLTVRASRFAIGIALLLCLKSLLGMVGESMPSSVGAIWLFLESTLLTFSIAFWIPWFFEKTIDRNTAAASVV